MIEVGDLVEWNVLTIHPEDLVTIHNRIKDGRRLDNMIITNQSSFQKHTGMVQQIEDGWVVVIDFVGRDTLSVHLTEVQNKLRILNRKQ